MNLLGAPEQVPRAGCSRGVYQTVDVWALGCVFSIAATWIALGHHGVRQYLQLRENANDRAMRRQGQSGDQRSPQLEYGDYFHDGDDVLPEVTAWHKYIRNILRETDRVTKQVLDVVDKHMLIKDPLQRWQASEVYDKWCRISMGLEDPTHSVPGDIIAFLATSEGDLNLLGSDAVLNKAAETSTLTVRRTHSGKDMKSRYFRAPYARTGTDSNSMSHISEQSPVLPETPRRTPSRIMSGLIHHSPTHSGFISPVFSSPDSEPNQQTLPSALPAFIPQPTFTGKNENIFQAHDKIEKSRGYKNAAKSYIKGKGRKPVDDYLATHYHERDIVSVLSLKASSPP